VAAIGRVRQTVAAAAGGQNPAPVQRDGGHLIRGYQARNHIGGCRGSLASETANTLRLGLAPA